MTWLVPKKSIDRVDRVFSHASWWRCRPELLITLAFKIRRENAPCSQAEKSLYRSFLCISLWQGRVPSERQAKLPPMRPPSRTLRAVLAACSLVVAVALGGAWAWSLTASHTVVWASATATSDADAYTFCSVQLCRGAIAYTRVRSFGPPELGIIADAEASTLRAGAWEHEQAPASDPDLPDVNGTTLLGFAASVDEEVWMLPTGERCGMVARLLIIPLWPLLVGASLLPLTCVATRLRTRRKASLQRSAHIFGAGPNYGGHFLSC